MQRQWWVAAAVLLGAGCGDDVAGSGETDDGGSTTSTSTGVPDDTSSSSSSSSTTDSLDTSSGEPSSSGEESSSSSGGGLTMLEVDVTRYPQQPMVVDVTVSGDGTLPDDLALTHDFDDGVRIAQLDEGARETTYRVRGLAPATKHALTVTGGEFTEPVAFTSEGPLPGFVPSFEVRGESSGERPYRMFDLGSLPANDVSSIFVVDIAGRTRWHLSFQGMNPFPGRLDAVTATELGRIRFGMQNRFLEVDELGNTIIELTDDDLGIEGIHHEVLTLPNGNIIVLAYSFRDVDYPGAPNTHVIGDVIVEFTPEGEVVWTWDTFDHLDPQRVLEPIEAWTIPNPATGVPGYDWTHGNGVAYRDEENQLLLSLRHQDWLVAIDRDTGEVDWILGNEGDFTLTSGTWFSHQHSPQWQDDGSLLLYDNGVVAPSGFAPNEIARAVRYELDLDAFTATQVWEIDEQDVSSPFAGDANVLPESGNYIVLDSTILTQEGFSARLRELDPEADPMLQWSLTIPTPNIIYRTSASEVLVGEMP